MKLLKYKFVVVLCILALSSCKDKWAEHNAIRDQNLNSNLYQQLEATPELSTFFGLIKKAGLGDVLLSSRSYTVWAPNNQALQGLSGEVVNNTDSLRKFVLNHIALQNYFVESYTSETVKLLSGKNATLSANAFNDHTMTASNTYVKNGVVHILNEPNAIVDNIYEFIQKWPGDSRVKNFINSLNYIGVDSTIAEVIAVDPDTGEPIYAPGSGEVRRNKYFERIADLNDENKKYTFVLLKDEGFDQDHARIRPYFNTLETKTTDSLTAWNVAKDLAFDSLYTAEQLNDSLLSIGGVQVKITPSTILERHEVSNGVVYVLNTLDYQLAYNKIKPVIIEGEFYQRKRREDRFPLIRSRRDPAGVIYKDVFLENHGTNQFWLRYMPVLNSVKYKVVWRAPRDYNLTGTITYSSMAVGFNWAYDILDPTDAVTDLINPIVLLPYNRIELQNYNEVDAGEYTPAKYGQVNTAIVGAAVTTNGQNTIVLDYIKLIPIFN